MQVAELTRALKQTRGGHRAKTRENRGEAVLDRFVSDFEISRVPFGEHHWREALAAYRRYGRSRHPAALNYGDCIAYATARLAGEPLLFVGADFAKTDIESA